MSAPAVQVGAGGSHVIAVGAMKIFRLKRMCAAYVASPEPELNF